MIEIGPYKISTITWGMFRLDGGAMFGSVPKNIWAKSIPVDEENCIPLAARSLLIEGDGKKILVDVGMGEKWNEKQRAIFGIKNRSFHELCFDPQTVTDVVLTHLHFDHAGGISQFGSDGKSVVPVFPNATVYVQKRNLENAKAPTLRERASYLPENWTLLEHGKTVLLNGNTEILPFIFGFEVDGHTKGQQWIEIFDGKKSVMFTTDVIPTSRHLPLPYTMGYDICTETVLCEKDTFLKQAMQRDAIVVYQHDPDLPASTIMINEKGHYAVKDKILL